MRVHRQLYILVLIFSLPSFLMAAPLIGIRINGGNRYTNNKEIKIEIRSLQTPDNLVEDMRVGLKSDLSDANWIKYTKEPQTLTLSGPDGEKEVFVQLRDKAGNTSLIESHSIILDTTPPTGYSITLNEGASFTNDKMGRVLIQVTPGDAAYMMFSNSEKGFTDAWEKVAPTFRWIIDFHKGDGEKTVYARFKDEAGNEGSIATASIIFDTKPPTDCSISINNDAKYTNSRNVTLKVKASDAELVRIVEGSRGENIDYKPGNDGEMLIKWQLDTLQGIKVIRAFFMDAAKNSTPNAVSASTVYDTRPPATPRVMIDKGKKFTNNPDGIVTINLLANESNEGLMMQISNRSDFTGSEFIEFKNELDSWTLDKVEDGLKDVYVKLKDQAGNISDPSKASIVLDRTPPILQKFTLNEGAEWTHLPKVALFVEAEGAYKMQINNTSNMTNAVRWEQFKPVRTNWQLLPGDGEKIIYLKLVDEAGNMTEVSNASIKLDTKPPTGSIAIDGGMKVTNSPGGVVGLLITTSEDALGMQVTNEPVFDSAKFEPIRPSIPQWVLSDGDGPKTIFLRLKDRAGNFSKIYTTSILLDRTPPSENEIIANNGNVWVNNKAKKVALSFRSHGAKAMMISNDARFEDAEWQPFKTAVGWQLEGEEGDHVVYVKFKDEAGNESESFSVPVKLDYTAPEVTKFSIDDDKAFTNDPQKRVTLNMDVSGAVEMVISNTPLSDPYAEGMEWEAYINRKDWILSNEDGLKTVYVRFKDEAGNVTHEFFDKIMLDRVAPTNPKVAINGGAKYLTNKDGKVKLNLFAEGAGEVLVSNSPSLSGGKWEKLEAEKEWIVNTNMNTVTVYVKYRDLAENETEIVSASILIDTDPPTNPSIVLDKGAEYVKSQEGLVEVSVNVHGADFMRISPEKSFANVKWEPIEASRPVNLGTKEGEKTVFAQFRDEAGNETDIVSATITIDFTPPKIEYFAINGGDEWTNADDKLVELTIRAEGATQMKIGQSSDLSSIGWTAYQEKVSDFQLSGEDGEKIIYLKLKDKAGNETSVVSAKINLKRSF